MTKKRWMISVLKATAETRVALPWERGQARATRILRRETAAKAKTASA